MENLNLYVWENVLCDYTCGVMFALAEDAEQARKIIKDEHGESSSILEGLGGEPKVYQEPCSYAIWGGG